MLSTPSAQAEFKEWKQQNPEVVAYAARTQRDLEAIWLEAKRGYAQGKARSSPGKKTSPKDPAPASGKVIPGESRPPEAVANAPPIQQQSTNIWQHLRRAYADAKVQPPEQKGAPGPGPAPAPADPKPKPTPIDLAFPVKGPHSYGNSWGAPRMVGTRYFHRHQGTDIFAPKGTPVVAVTDGKLERVGPNTLGGNRLWLRSSDTSSYYYAHLDGYANRIRDGTQVRREETLGYVGNTGNASRAPPHLHFEAHLPGVGPVNPYPILKGIEGKR